MKQSTLLSIISLTASCIGALAFVAPELLLVHLKHAQPNAAALTMARTTGALLLATGGLAFTVRKHEASPTLRSVIGFLLAVQLLLLPIDPLAYASGTFQTLGSFVPNTILHIVLAVMLASAWRGARTPAMSS